MTDLSQPAAPAAEVSIGKKMRAGVFYWGLGNAASRVLRFGAQFILVWLLLPADFGLVAMTAALMNVLQLMSEFGVGIAVIQKKDMQDSYVHTAFWLNMGVSILTLAISWVSAPWIADFYGAEEIRDLIRVTSLSFPVMALRTVPISLLRKRMQFGLNSALETAWNGISGLLMIALALLGASYWSLVLPAMIVGFFMTPVWYAYAKWRPRFHFVFADFWELLAYSKNLVGAGLLSVILGNAGFVIAGHLLGTEAAGLFNVATAYSTVVLVNFAWLIGNVSLSGFAAKQGEAAALQTGFMRIYEFLAATTLPVHVLGVVLAPVLFATIFPERYQPALFAFQCLLACAAVRCLGAHMSPLYNAISKAYVNFYNLLVMTPLSIACMYVACRYAATRHGAQAGLDALALAAAGTQIALAIALFVVMRWVLGWRISLVRPLVPYILASMAAAGSAKAVAYAWGLVSTGLPTRVDGAIVVVMATGVGMAVYGVTLLIFARPRVARLVSDVVPARWRERLVYPWLPGLRLPAPTA